MDTYLVTYGNACVNCGQEIEVSFVLPRETLCSPESIQVGCGCDMGYPDVTLYRRRRSDV